MIRHVQIALTLAKCVQMTFVMDIRKTTNSRAFSEMLTKIRYDDITWRYVTFFTPKLKIKCLRKQKWEDGSNKCWFSIRTLFYLSNEGSTTLLRWFLLKLWSYACSNVEKLCKNKVSLYLHIKSEKYLYDHNFAKNDAIDFKFRHK